MKTAPIPSNDAERVRALETYEILDTPAEPHFDAIARLAALVLDVPIALVSLVDDDRQWFKAHYGLAAPETPRDVSFCGHAVADRAPLVVRDALADARFADNPLVLGEPRVRFYAGMPLHTQDGFVLGTLCAIDHQAREPSPAQLEALGLLAEQVVALLELRRVGQLLREERSVLAESERTLAESERTLETVFEGMVEGVVLQDRSGAILHHNQAAETILGLSRDQLIGTSPRDPRWEATHPDGSPFPGDEHPAMVTLRTGQPLSDIQMCIHKPAGELGWLAINSRPLVQPGDPLPYAVITTFRDITEQRETAERLAHHQRLVTAGTLAAGVGHEINNPLAYVLTNVTLAIEELEGVARTTPSRRLVEIIAMLEAAREGGERVKRIVRGLKSLARDDAELVPTDLNAIVRNALELAGHEIRTRATARLDLADGVLLARGDESRLSQVFINLLVNAAQAFTRPDPSTNLIVVRTRGERDACVVEVTDNGPGIDPAVEPRIFDPFFTTKPVGLGTGLGLAISHGIVTTLGGEISCKTQLGHGTTFRITLPVAVAAPPAIVVPGTLGRMLVIDDEQEILGAIARVFHKDFEVVTVEDPREALRRIMAGELFDVVFCDLSMPYLSGMELHDAIAASRPEIAQRMVFISGDLTRDEIRRFLARVPNARLEKPVSVQDLRATARRFVRTL